MNEEIIKMNKVIKDFEGETITKSEVMKELRNLHSSNCSRCADKLSERWENKANKFVLDIEFAGSSYSQLWGKYNNNDNDIDFNLHPAITKSGAQHVVIECEKDKAYRLCEACYRDFASVVGDFLMSGV